MTVFRSKQTLSIVTALLFSGAAYPADFCNQFGKCRALTPWETCVHEHQCGQTDADRAEADIDGKALTYEQRQSDVDNLNKVGYLFVLHSWAADYVGPDATGGLDLLMNNQAMAAEVRRRICPLANFGTPYSPLFGRYWKLRIHDNSGAVIARCTIDHRPESQSNQSNIPL
jgi:hypothetical protein